MHTQFDKSSELDEETDYRFDRLCLCVEITLDEYQIRLSTQSQIKFDFGELR